MAARDTLRNKPLAKCIELNPVHKGSCHCSTIQVEVNLPNGLVDPRHCNCFMCCRRSAVVASVELKDLTITKGADKLSLYQCCNHTAKHFFCSIFGIYTHHQRRSNTKLYA